jgi:hypothetical protein
MDTVWLIIIVVTGALFVNWLKEDKEKKIWKTEQDKKEKQEDELALPAIKELKNQLVVDRADTPRIVSQYQNYIGKFCEIAEREVSIKDEWGDENWDILPELKKQCVVRIALPEMQNRFPDKEKKKLLEIINSWFIEKDVYENKKGELYMKDLATEQSIEQTVRNYGKYITEYIDEIKQGFVPYWAKHLFEEHLPNIFDAYHKQKKQTKQYKNQDINKMSGIEFENYVSKLLTESGYNVSGTPPTGDQGADLIASKNGNAFVIQIKRHSKPIGNKAVQEVVAAKSYYQGDKASVVTNSTFTNAAKNLAKRNDVILIGKEQLKSIEVFLQ